MCLVSKWKRERSILSCSRVLFSGSPVALPRKQVMSMSTAKPFETSSTYDTPPPSLPSSSVVSSSVPVSTPPRPPPPQLMSPPPSVPPKTSDRPIVPPRVDAPSLPPKPQRPPLPPRGESSRTREKIVP